MGFTYQRKRSLDQVLCAANDIFEGTLGCTLFGRSTCFCCRKGDIALRGSSFCRNAWSVVRSHLWAISGAQVYETGEERLSIGMRLRFVLTLAFVANRS